VTTTLLARPTRSARRPAISATRPAAAAVTRLDGAAPAPSARPDPSGSEPGSEVELPADLPLHALVTHAQGAERTGVAVLRLTGPQAAAVASRLLRLTRTVTIEVELDLAQGARGAALDAVALARIGGGRVHVLVRDAEQRHALARELGLRPRALASRFGGDAFAAVLPLSGPDEIAVVVAVDTRVERSRRSAA